MASSQTIAEAIENSLNAFNIISKENLKSISYDTTIKCKIISVANRELGEYQVTDGTSTFLAYSEKTDYINGQLVWVTIPQGDYSKQKIITGKYIESDNSEYYTYVHPLDSFIDITDNLIESNMINMTGLIANGEVEEIPLWSIYGREYKGYDRLAISAGFKSWLKQLNVKSGTYGLRLDITSKIPGTSQTSNDRKFYSIVLNTNDFYGDVYNFETFYDQAKVIDISMIDCIDSMSLIFYQGKDFKINETEPLRYENPNDDNQNLDLSNIWVNNPYIGLGYDVDKFKTDTVLLYTLDSSTYASYLSERAKDLLEQSLNPNDFDSYEDYLSAINDLHNDQDTIELTLRRLNRKNMQVRWIHFSSEDEKPQIIDSEEDFQNLQSYEKDKNPILHWYQYKLDEGVKDQLAGNYWVELKEYQNKFELKNFRPDITQQSEKFKVIIEYPSQEYVSQTIIYDKDMFTENNTLQDTDKFKYFRDEHNEEETYYNWVCRGLDFIEEQKMAIVKILANDETISEEGWAIYEEYLQALKEESYFIGYEKYLQSEIGNLSFEQYVEKVNNNEIECDWLQPTDAAANAINKKYEKKIMNIETDLQDQKSLYNSIYNKIVGVLGQVKYYYSDILEFTCEDLLPNQATIDLIKGLSLTVDEDGYKGNYRIYNNEGQILSKKESQKKRIITANWNSVITGDRALDGIERIEWYIPIQNTMIQYPEEGVEYMAYEQVQISNQIAYASYQRDLYLYNLIQNTYVKINKSTHQFSINEKYYVKNNTTYSLYPTADNPTHFKIVRQGQSFEDHEPGTEEPSSSGQIFRVKEFYSQNYTNNTIRCVIRKNNEEYAAEANLLFGPTGTNGTDYSFELEIANKIQAITTDVLNSSTITIIPHLYDFDGNDVINNYIGTLKYSWWSPTNPVVNMVGTKHVEDNNRIFYTPLAGNQGRIDLTLDANVSIENVRYHILYAELTNAVTFNNQKITLMTYRPIPVRSSERYVAIDGADKISYDSSGVNPSYYKNPYKIYIYKNKATIPIESDEDANENPVKWEVVLGNDTRGVISGESDEKFYPVLSENYALIPPSYFLQDNGKQIAVECYDQFDNIIWTQPIYIYQNSFSSSLLNSWDGKLTIDEENGTILSTMVGAGAKDDKNRFQGVIMGDLRDLDNTKTFGLYGYNEGIQNFGLKIDGTAFLGKSGKGQINFDGNSGRISSLSYNIDKESPQGMLIDLDDGFIDARGANLKNIKYSDGVVNNLTIDDVLEYQYNIYNDEIALYESQIQPLNAWADKVLIALYNSRKKRIEDKKEILENIINELSEIEDSRNEEDPFTDYEKLKYLQDHNATFLINDDVFTPVYEPSKSRIRLSTTDPYFIVTSENETDMMRISHDAYFLQTDNFIFAKGEKELFPYKDDKYLSFFKDNDSVAANEDGYGQGMLFDLSHGYLLGYNFKLKSVNNGKEGDEYAQAMKDSYFELNSSGDPFLVVHFKSIHEDVLNPLKEKWLINQNAEFIEKDLIWISRDNFFLQSFNYFPHAEEIETEFGIVPVVSAYGQSEISGYKTNGIDPKKVGAGVKLDLTGGKLIGHDFEINAIDSGSSEGGRYTGSYVVINSSGQPYFRIHYQDIEDVNDRERYSDSSIWYDIDSNGIYKNKNIDLINISKSAWEINSKDFQRPLNGAVGKGIHFDLEGTSYLSTENNGKSNKGSYIEAYSFGLDAYRPGLYTQDVTSRLHINSAATGLLDISKGTNGQITVPIVNHNYLCVDGHRYSETEIWEIIDNRFSFPEQYEWMKDRYEENGYHPIDSIIVDYYDHPLIIGGLFSVSWDGKVTAGWLDAKQGGQIGPFTIREKALYSNNGLLANGQEFYDSNGEPTLVEHPSHPGVYLGRDGLSVSDTFVIYNKPINRWNGLNANDFNSNLNTNESHSLKIPTNVFSSEDYDIEYNYIHDFVTSGDYNDVDISEYFEDLNDASYDQIFQTSNGTILALKDLSFYLNGNSVLNGITAINGNTYIYGNMQVGEPDELEELDDTKNTVVMYANSTIYGIFRTTGKTFIGSKDGKWYSDQIDLRNDARDLRSALDESSSSNNESGLGFIVYRNSYISGFLKVAGSMVVGDANVDTIFETNYYDAYDRKVTIKNLHGDFTSYTLNSRFYGDVEVAAGFVAGSLIDDENASNNLPDIYEISGDQISQVPGSGIQSSHIFLGRVPEVLREYEEDTHNDLPQSNLSIYANTEQWGSFSAGRFGSTIELYANNTSEDALVDEAAYLIMDNNGISIRTYDSKPFTLDTNGGDILLDGSAHTSKDGYVDETLGGNIDIISGTGENRHLKLRAGEKDYIWFEGYNTNLDEPRAELKISSTGSFFIEIKDEYDNNDDNASSFSIDENGMIVKLNNSLNFSITATDGIKTNEFNISEEQILLVRGKINENNYGDNYLLMDDEGTYFHSTGSDFSIIAGSKNTPKTNYYNELTLNDDGILIEHIDQINYVNGEYPLNKLEMNKDGTTFISTGSNFSVTAGIEDSSDYFNKLILNDNGILIEHIDQTITDQGEYLSNKLEMTNDGTTFISTGSIFDIIAGKRNSNSGYFNELKLDDDGIEIYHEDQANNKENYLKMTNEGTKFHSTGSDFIVEAGEKNNIYNELKLDDDGIEIYHQKGNSEEDYFKITENGTEFKTTSSNFSVIAGSKTEPKTDYYNELSLNDQHILIQHIDQINDKENQIEMTDDSTSIISSGTIEFISSGNTLFDIAGSTFSVTAGDPDSGPYEQLILNEDKILISRKASRSVNTDDNKLEMNDSGTIFTSTGSDFSVTAGENGENYFKLNDSGISISGVSDNFNLEAGDNKIIMNSNSIQIISKTGANITLGRQGIAISSDENGTAYVNLNNKEAYFGIDSASIKAFLNNGTPTLLFNGQTTINTGARMDIDGDCYVHGSIFADNLRYDEDGGVIIGGLPETPNFPTGGFNLGGNQDWIGGWIINTTTLESANDPKIGLDPVNSKVWFNSSDNTGDYIDGGGSSSSSGSGLFLHSSNMIEAKTSRFDVMISNGNHSTERLYVSDSSIGLRSDDIYLNGKTSFGTGQSVPGGNTQYSAWVDTDGSAQFKDLTLSTGDLELSLGSLKFGSNAEISYDSNNGLTIKTSGNNQKPITLNGKGVNIQYAGTDKLLLSNTGLEIDTTVTIGSNAVNGTYNLIVNKGDIEISGSGKSLKTNLVESTSGTLTVNGAGGLILQTNSGSNPGLIDLKPGNSSVLTVASSYINLYQDTTLSSGKEFKFYINGSQKKLSDLKALAWATDIKKKFKLNALADTNSKIKVKVEGDVEILGPYTVRQPYYADRYKEIEYDVTVTGSKIAYAHYAGDNGSWGDGKKVIASLSSNSNAAQTDTVTVNFSETKTVYFYYRAASPKLLDPNDSLSADPNHIKKRVELTQNFDWELNATTKNEITFVSIDENGNDTTGNTINLNDDDFYDHAYTSGLHLTVTPTT